jgi:hypothetical protein
MQRNSGKCGHCGRMFVRTDRTSIVNRSDGKTFHVTLISGPDPSPLTSGGLHKNQAMCKFGYVHDRIGPKRYFLDVFIAYPDDGRQAMLQQVESAADKIADLMCEGRELGSTYALYNGLLARGFPGTGRESR